MLPVAVARVRVTFRRLRLPGVSVPPFLDDVAVVLLAPEQACICLPYHAMLIFVQGGSYLGLVKSGRFAVQALHLFVKAIERSALTKSFLAQSEADHRLATRGDVEHHVWRGLRPASFPHG